MSVNLDGLSSKELEDLIAKASQRRKVLAKRKPAAQVRAAVGKLLRDSGWTFQELFGVSGVAKADAAPAASPGTARRSTKGRKLGKVAPKYRNPANPKETWAGRGQQPKWLAAETAKGRSLDEFLIG